ncbi:chromatin-modulating protein mrc1 [Desmophyllum pertusum]|uniref:Chromatin-modulating protein mrc1 n=1 Tax=Desmophyllum pertusum TaxID=174260 RepID=A0A9W9ZW10_9CNID|nr:chromatin-modulating protein mrc1 [Desmophyllum pertusum]
MAVNCGFLLLVWFLFSGFAVSRAQGKLYERCEKGWRLYGGNCYFRKNNKRETWQGAQDVCAKQQANLVTVNDAHEQKFVAGIVGKRGSWCGLNNQDNKNEFKWVSGEQSGYTLWATNQPSKSSKKRCAHILSANKGNKWKMSKCANKFRFICEKGRSGIYNYLINYNLFVAPFQTFQTM